MTRPPNTVYPLLVSAAAYGLGVVLTLCLTDSWEARQTWIVTLTGLVVIWYTWETSRLRQAGLAQVEIGQRQVEATLQQIQLSREQLVALQLQTASLVRPFVVAQPEGDELRLDNLGAGPALNVRVRQMVVTTASADWTVTVDVPGSVPVLRPGTGLKRAMVTAVNGSPQGTFFTGHVHPKFAVTTIEIFIEYDSVDKHHYTARQRVAPKSLEILGYDDGAGHQAH